MLTNIAVAAAIAPYAIGPSNLRKTGDVRINKLRNCGAGNMFESSIRAGMEDFFETKTKLRQIQVATWPTQYNMSNR
jgi:hypothetical protein